MMRFASLHAILSDAIGTDINPLSRVSISEIERGARRVDVDDLMALAAGLDVTPAHLLSPEWRETVPVAGFGDVARDRYARWVRSQVILFSNRRKTSKAGEATEIRSTARRIKREIEATRAQAEALQRARETADADSAVSLGELHQSALEALSDLQIRLSEAHATLRGLEESEQHGHD